MIMSKYLSVPAGAIRFAYGPNGKPALDPTSDAGLQFSLASSGDVALYAVTSQGSVGVDVEAFRALIDLTGLIARFFTPREAALLAGLTDPERERLFFAGWTRKEAYLKALGEGLSRPPNQVDVSPGSDLGGWTIETIVPLPGLVGAVAAPGSDWRIRRLDWAPSRAVPS
jgi:4'-phosphopantetheinyl transferase